MDHRSKWKMEKNKHLEDNVGDNLGYLEFGHDFLDNAKCIHKR